MKNSVKQLILNTATITLLLLSTMAFSQIFNDANTYTITEKPENARWVIRSGFESDVFVENDFLKGIDNMYPAPSNNWGSLGDINMNSNLNNGTGKVSIIPDPFASANKVLSCEIFTPDDVKGRVQISFNFVGTYNEFYNRYRWFIPNDWEALKALNPHGFINIWELWTKQIPENQSDTYDGAGSFRMGFSFRETSSTSNVFEWHLKGENRTYYTSEGVRRWERTNKNIAVPFGKWATVEVYVQKGPDPKANNQSPARFVLRLKPDGGQWQTVFDIKDERTEHSHRPQNGYGRAQPFKNYTQANNINFLNSIGLRTYLLYDDFEFWAGPGGIPLRTNPNESAGLEKTQNILCWPNPFNPGSETLNISYPADKESNSMLRIYNTKGLLIDEVRFSNKLSHNNQDLVWNGRNKNGEVLPNGLYIGKIYKESKVFSFRVVIIS